MAKEHYKNSPIGEAIMWGAAEGLAKEHLERIKELCPHLFHVYNIASGQLRITAIDSSREPFAGLFEIDLQCGNNGLKNVLKATPSGSNPSGLKEHHIRSTHQFYKFLSDAFRGAAERRYERDEEGRIRQKRTFKPKASAATLPPPPMTM